MEKHRLNIKFERLFYFFGTIYLAFILLGIFLFEKGDDVSYPLFFGGSLVLFILFFIKELKTDSLLFTSWIKPSNIFLLSFVIVNFQVIISTWLEYETIGTYLETSKYSGYISKVFYLGLVGLIFYMFGYSYLHLKKSYKSIWQNRTYTHLNIHVWALLSLVAFVLFVVNIDLVSFLTGMDYEGSGASDRETTSYAIWETLFDTFVTLTVATKTVMCLNDDNKKSLFRFLLSFPFYFLISVVLYIALRLVSGDRGPVMYTSLLFFYSYLLVSKKRIRLGIVMLSVLIGAFGMTLLNSVRGYRNPNENFIDKVSRSFSDMEDESNVKSISPFSYELSKSVNCNFIAVHDIDENITEYKYGLYNLCEILSAVPGMNRITTSLFNLDLYRTTTSEYVTISFFGKNYPYGLGTTVITDFYLDFGLLGVIIGMFVVGIVYRRVDENLVYGSIPSFFAMVFFLKFASMSVYIPRASFSFVLCRVLYIMVFYYVFNSLFILFKYFISIKRQ